MAWVFWMWFEGNTKIIHDGLDVEFKGKWSVKDNGTMFFNSIN